MKCKACGFEFSEGIFCPECGCKIETGNDEKTNDKALGSEIISVKESTENEVKTGFEKEQNCVEETKAADIMALLCMVFGVAIYPLLITTVFWFFSMIVSIIFGVRAIKRKSKKRGFLITGFICDAIMILIMVLLLT